MTAFRTLLFKAKNGSFLERGNDLLQGAASRERGIKLPDIWVTNSVFRTFLASEFRLVFLLLDRVLSRETVALAYTEGTPPSLEFQNAKACVFALLSLAGSLFLDLDFISPFQVDDYATGARVLLSEFFENPSRHDPADVAHVGAQTDPASFAPLSCANYSNHRFYMNPSVAVFTLRPCIMPWRAVSSSVCVATSLSPRAQVILNERTSS
ncbi:hypothetical protein HIM_07330 [Hirsutella minnesotensis 3608]|uniref:Uncharacterized protein n=1 Tax=Hirsutella minnesotensis 3608 TaxID=1043627 RepID=A0A0F7ZI09_9HYPO|nr:hypothetical protein HIM_07330 [Hirsutella minnesotensis 3608]